MTQFTMNLEVEGSLSKVDGSHKITIEDLYILAKVRIEGKLYTISNSQQDNDNPIPAEIADFYSLELWKDGKPEALLGDFETYYNALNAKSAIVNLTIDDALEATAELDGLYYGIDEDTFDYELAI